LDFIQVKCTGVASAGVAGEDAVLICASNASRDPDPSGFKSIHAPLKDYENRESPESSKNVEVI
jgi:hypothetical protein